jgi:hypothetical protein
MGDATDETCAASALMKSHLSGHRDLRRLIGGVVSTPLLFALDFTLDGETIRPRKPCAAGVSRTSPWATVDSRRAPCYEAATMPSAGGAPILPFLVISLAVMTLHRVARPFLRFFFAFSGGHP